MNPSSGKKSDQLTVLVFKDNYAARTFQVSLKWISRLGIVLGTCLLVTLISGFLAFKYFRLSRLSYTAPFTELDHTTQLSQALATPAPKVSEEPKALASPSTTPTTLTQAPNLSHLAPYQFTNFADSNLESPPAPTELPFTIQSPKLTWKNKTLLVRFALQYVKDDGNNQQGRIVILARSPNYLIGYPDGILNLPGKKALISPEHGEFFSVSRFREVKADFNLVREQDTLSSIEIFIFDTNGKLLVYQALTPPSRSTPPPRENNEQSK